MNILLPAPLVSLITALAGIAWLFYSRSQKGRYQSGVLAWLSLPFFALSLIYLWFTIIDVDIDIRAIYARFGIISIALPQAIILIILSFLYGGTDGKQRK